MEWMDTIKGLDKIKRYQSKKITLQYSVNNLETENEINNCYNEVLKRNYIGLQEMSVARDDSVSARIHM